jgi:hypothetical protein
MTRTLKVLGHVYEVRDSTKLVRERNTAGTCCAGTLEIELDPDSPVTRYEEALLHEVFEALNYHLSLDLNHDKMSALSEGLFQVLADNGLKTAWRSA